MESVSQPREPVSEPVKEPKLVASKTDITSSLFSKAKTSHPPPQPVQPKTSPNPPASFSEFLNLPSFASRTSQSSTSLAPDPTHVPAMTRSDSIPPRSSFLQRAFLPSKPPTTAPTPPARQLPAVAGPQPPP